MMAESISISRDNQLINRVVIVDGFPGCGKTMLSPIISAFSNVEIMQYGPLIEQISELWGLRKIEDDVAISMIKMNVDLLIYNVMMGRNTNCRPGDISSIFRDKPFKYIKRMLKRGDEAVPELINRKKPILHLTTHMLLPNSRPLFEALGKKLTFVEVVRHPLYMIIQQEKNFKMFEGARNQHIRYRRNGNEYTFFSDGWEKEFDSFSSFEKSIYSIKWYYEKIRSIKYDNNFIVPFEKYVKEPDSFMQKIANSLSSDISQEVAKEMKRQKVPRKVLADSPALKIYERCGWRPPTGVSEADELNERRKHVAKQVSLDMLKLLDTLSDEYIHRYIDR